MATLRKGLSGWVYREWRGRFYPPALLQRRELEFASTLFNTLEINGSFYSLQRSKSYQRWRAETPRDFVFAVKGSRFITHDKKLGDVRVPLANFFASGILALEEKLGPTTAGDLDRITTATAPERPRDVFLYFDNDQKVNAPRNALRLAELLRRED